MKFDVLKNGAIDWDAFMSSVVQKECEYWSKKRLQMLIIQRFESDAPNFVDLVRTIDTQPDDELVRYWQASFRTN